MANKKFKELCIIIGKRIKEQRLKHGLTQEELADKVNINPKFVSHLERGVGFPSLETFIKLAEALETSLDSLISDYNNNSKKTKKEENKNLTKLQSLFVTLTEQQQKQILAIVKDTKKLFKK